MGITTQPYLHSETVILTEAPRETTFSEIMAIASVEEAMSSITVLIGTCSAITTATVWEITYLIKITATEIMFLEETMVEIIYLIVPTITTEVITSSEIAICSETMEDKTTTSLVII
jgi:hypothetical protein